MPPFGSAFQTVSSQRGLPRRAVLEHEPAISTAFALPSPPSLLLHQPILSNYKGVQAANEAQCVPSALEELHPVRSREKQIELSAQSQRRQIAATAAVGTAKYVTEPRMKGKREKQALPSLLIQHGREENSGFLCLNWGRAASRIPVVLTSPNIQPRGVLPIDLLVMLSSRVTFATTGKKCPMAAEYTFRQLELGPFSRSLLRTHFLPS